MKARYRVVDTSRGKVGFVATASGLRRVYLPLRSHASIVRKIQSEFPDSVEDSRLMPPFAATLRDYAGGKPVEFDVRFDWTGFSTFEADVWHACQRIPYGRTASYKDIAERVGRPGAARAVGTAMSHNPCPLVVPCHRVVKSDGSLGGYSGAGGVHSKRSLLNMETEAHAAPA